MSGIPYRKEVLLGLGTAGAAAILYCQWAKYKAAREDRARRAMQEESCKKEDRARRAMQTPVFGDASKTILPYLAPLDLNFSEFDETFRGKFRGPFNIDLGPIARSRTSRTIGPAITILGSSRYPHVTCSLDFHGDEEILVLRAISGACLCTCALQKTNGPQTTVAICGGRGGDSGKCDPWGHMKPFGRDRDDVYWHIVNPDYMGVNAEVAHKPIIHIGQMLGSRSFKICLWDPLVENLPGRKPPGSQHITGLSFAKGTILGDNLTVHLAPYIEDNWCTVLVLALALSLEVFRS